MPAVASDAPPRLMSGVAAPPTHVALQAIARTSAAAKLAAQQRLGTSSGSRGLAESGAAATAAGAEAKGSEAKVAAASAPAAVGSRARAADGDAAVVADAGSLRALSLDALSVVVAKRTKAVRALKAAKKVFEVDPEAKAAAKALQDA
jgi:hypothetical protein